MAAAPPAPLAAAIQQAAQHYGISPDVLTGIWRVESGSSYPNPYVNSSGYGGLFGTTHYNTSPQDQANLAAKILTDNIRSHGGSLPAALLAYSGGGYSSVNGSGGAAPASSSPPTVAARVAAPTPAAPQVDPGLIALLLQNTQLAQPVQETAAPKVTTPVASQDFFTPLVQSQQRAAQTGLFQLPAAIRPPG